MKKQINMKQAFLSLFLFFGLILSANSAEWSANWIWSSATGTPNTWMCFRKTVDLTAVPATVIAKIGADSKYWLWINGEMVVFEGAPGRGPSPGNTWYEEVNIQPYLKTGTNTIAVQVWYFGRSQSGHISSGKAGLVFQAELDGTLLKSDNTWKIKLNEAYDAASGGGGGSVIPYSVKYDANLALGDWTSEGFNDANWTNATQKGIPPIGPWNKLEKNYVPNLKDHGLAYYENYPESAFPFTSTGAEITCNLDYNKQLTPYLDVESDSGKTITISAINLGTDNLTNSITATYITKPGIQSFESLSWMNGQSIKYIIPAGVIVKALKYRWTSIGEAPGTFECSDPFYQKLWWMARNTLIVCARDNFMDCPDRERSLWIGDVADQCSGIFYSMDEPGRNLMKKAIMTAIAFRNSGTKAFGSGAPGWGSFELPAQSLQFVYDGIWNYYLNTGDLETIKKVYPAVHDYLAIYKMAANGFPEYRKGNWDWNDWGVDSNNGVVPDQEMMQICQYYMALQAAKKMAIAIENTTKIAWYDERMNGIQQKFNSTFWNGKYYSTGNNKEDRANALAIVSGLADSSKFASIVNQVLVPVIKSSPHMEWIVEDAMCKAGFPVQAIERMKERYVYQVEKTKNTTLNELFGTSGYLGTYNHAWNAPNTVLSRYIAGVTPDSAGWSTYHVLPMYAGISSVKTMIPTVKGDIHFEVAFNEKSEALTLVSPEGTTAIVGIPKKTITINTIILNGQKIWDGTFIPSVPGVKFINENEHFIKFSVGSGTWQFVADGCSKIIKPTVQVNTSTPIQSTNIMVKLGDKLVFSPEPLTGGSWSWMGSNGLNETTRSITLTNIQTAQIGKYVATYTNECGEKTVQDFNICGPIAVTPYIEIDGVRTKTSTATVNSGTKVIFDPEPLTGGTWSWSGCGTSGFSRQQTIYPTIQGTATAIFTNDCGVTSTRTFSLKVPDGGFKIPGKIEAEEFITMQSVQIELTGDDGGGKNVGGIQSGDWLEFPIIVPSTGKYKISFRIATSVDGGKLILSTNGLTLSTTNVPNTTGWQKWVTIHTEVPLSEGIHTIRLQASGNQWNFNWWSADYATGISDVQLLNDNTIIYPNPAGDSVNIKLISQEPTSIRIFDTNGKVVYSISDVKGELSIPTNEIGGSGVYMVNVGVETLKLIIQ